MSIENKLIISAPKFKIVVLEIEGTSPYLQNRFSKKAMDEMRDKMEAGSTSQSKKKREARDFDSDFKEAMHISESGWHGIPAAAFRNAAIKACATVNFHMTKARMSIFVEADGFDKIDGSPLVQLIGDYPEKSEMLVRIQKTVDIRVRPMWRKWSAMLRVRYDEDQFKMEDVVNLFMRAGMQVGVGEGRPGGTNTAGMGYGLFQIKSVTQ
jgi:hypothetical protein